MPGDLPDILIPAPAKGLLEGWDPATADFPADAAPDLENIRVEGGLWEPRLGMASSIAAAGSGAGRLLATHYTATARYRMLARGNMTAAVLYKLLVGTDAAWVATTGGTGLGNSDGDLFQGVSLGGRFYFTDRQNALKVWNPSDNAVTTVAQPTAPTNGPRVVPRTYALFDSLAAGTEPWGWTESNNGNFDLTTYTDIELPASGSYGASTVRRLLVKSTAAVGNTITKDRQEYPVPSLTIALWLEQEGTALALATVEYGITAAAQFSAKLDPGEKDVTKILFIPIGSIGSLSYFRFRCVRRPASNRNIGIGPLMLPGNLQGRYRWVYTHYDPTTGEESAPSPYSNSGEFSDFSQIGASYDNSTAENEGSALYKSAAVIPESDSGSDSATTRIRFYRQGGIAELTKNANGEDILTRVGEIPDLTTTLNGGVSAADTKLILTAVGNGGGNVGDGDGLIIEEGVDGKEEICRIAHLRLFDFQIDAVNNLKITSGSYNFDANDASGVVVILGRTAGGSGTWTAAEYTISSISGTAAILATSPAAVSSTGGYGYIKAVNATSKRVFLADGLANAHLTGVAVKAVFLDNVADAAVDASNTLDEERGNPPSGVRSVAKAPDGRLWLFGWPLRPMGYAVSNKPTPERTRDYEVFPDNVDVYTRRSETQGFRDDLAGDNSGDSLVWGGFLNGTPTALSRKGLWQIYASGQSDFGRTSVQKLFDTGCIATDSVQIVNDALYWVAPGPRVMRWNGQRESEPQDISFKRCNVTLADAPTAYWGKWWAQAHADKKGAYYRLWMVPSVVQSYTDLVIDASLNTKVTSASRNFVAADVGRILYVSGGTGFTVGYYVVVSVASNAATLDRAVGTTGSTGGTGSLADPPSKRMDYNIVQDAWEPVVYYDSGAAAIPFATGTIFDVSTDVGEILALHATSGVAYQLETGATDAGEVIRIRAKTRKFSLGGAVSLIRSFWLRLTAVTDSLSVSVLTGGSQYGDVTNAYNGLSVSGSGDVEVKQRVAFDQKGRWAQFTLTGNLSNRASLRELGVWFSRIRSGKVG